VRDLQQAKATLGAAPAAVPPLLAGALFPFSFVPQCRMQNGKTSKKARRKY